MPLLTVQLTDEDHAALKGKAKAAGMTMAAYIRARCLDIAPSRPIGVHAGPPPLTHGPAPSVVVPGLADLIDEH